MSRFLLAFVLGGCLLAGCAKEAPQAVVQDPALALGQKFADAYRQRDWGGVFDLASTKEIEANSITKPQFVSLMQAVSADVPDIFSGATLAPLSSVRPDLRFYLVRNGVSTPAEDMKGTAPGLLVTLFKDKQDWRAYVMPTVSGVNLYTPGPASRRWAKLAEAMERLKIQKLQLLDTQAEVTARNLRLASEGRIAGDQILDARDPETPE